MSSYRRIEIAEARALAGREGANLLDVRDPRDFQKGHVEGARNVGEKDLPGLVRELNKSAPLVIYCYHGNSSQLYARIFADLGFADVYSVDGGYEAWQASEQTNVVPAGGFEPPTY